MYLRKLHLENVGPIEALDFDLPFVDGNPQPVVFVGQNGSGKSIVTSYVVNYFLSAQVEVFENAEVERGKVFKLRSPLYIRSGKSYSYARLDFANDSISEEWIR